jgi:tetratricopeptide (TPR) repeat protein
MKSTASNPAPPVPAKRSARLPILVAATMTAVLTAVVIWWFSGRESAEVRADRDLAAAKRAMDVGNLATAEKHLLAAIESVPQSAMLRHNLGVLYLRQDRLTDARSAFEAAARAHAPEAGAVRAEEYFQLASISVKEKEWKRAEGELRNAILADPSRPLLHARLVDLQIGSLQDSSAAATSAAAFLRACGETPENLYHVGFIYSQHEDAVRAEAWARRAVARADTLERAHALIATSLAQQGRSRDALQYLETRLQEQPRSGELWIARARIAMTLGARADVVAAADRAVALMPNHFEARLVRMQALGGVGRLDEALAEAGRARALAAEEPQRRRLRIEESSLQRAIGLQRKLAAETVTGAVDTTGARP